MSNHLPTILEKNNQTNNIPKYLVVKVESLGKTPPEKINIRIPLGLLKAGVKLATFIPSSLQEKINQNLKDKGVPFNMEMLQNQQSIDLFLETLKDFHVDIESEKDNIKIFCE
jgi:hypothetical protein